MWWRAGEFGLDSISLWHRISTDVFWFSAVLTRWGWVHGHVLTETGCSNIARCVPVIWFTAFKVSEKLSFEGKKNLISAPEP
jgi:hypothetical protein